MPNLLAGCRGLVVDDEFLVLMELEWMLGELGCDSVVTAGTVEKAIALTSLHKFDFAMLDVNLNGERSYPVADALIALSIPFVFTTGYTGMIANTIYRDRPVLDKPYDFNTLVEAMINLVGKHGVV